MSATTRAHCRACGRHKSTAGEITWAGYCSICGNIIRNANIDQLHAGEGRFYEHWVYRSELAAKKRRLELQQRLAAQA